MASIVLTGTFAAQDCASDRKELREILALGLTGGVCAKEIRCRKRRKLEKPSPARGTGLLNRRNACVLSPIVVRGGQENRRMVERGRKKRPHEDLFIADEHGGVLIVDVDYSPGKEIQWYTVPIKRLPHCDGDGNAFLIKRGIVLPAREQHIQVVVLCKRISWGSRWIDTSSDKDGAVLRCDRG